MNRANQAVLIVDDQAENISTAVGLLKEMGLQQKIYSAPNGEKGYELALKYKPNLILTDWDMPVMDGLDLVATLKNNDELKDIPVIMITGVMTSPGQLQRAFAMGVHDFIKKPYHSMEFFARVGNTLKLQQAHNDISTANSKLHDLNVLKDNIFAVISHDIKAPLLNLNGLINLTIDNVGSISPEEAKEHYGNVGRQVANVTDLLRNLLEWSQSQLNNELIRLEIQPHLLINEIFQFQNATADQKDVLLINQIPDDLKIVTDPNAFSFILRNFIVNAVKFTENGQVSIDVEVEGDYVNFSVTDTGVGMEKETINNLFKGTRVDSLAGTKNEPGTGIGLTLCKMYSEKLNGEIEVSSSLGDGSTFYFRLPIKAQ